MPGPAFLYGDRVVLTTIEEEDLPTLQALVNDPAVNAGLGAHTPTNASQEAEWFESVGTNGEDLLICLETGDQEGEEGQYEAIGEIGLHELNETWGRASVGYFVDPEHWNNGYATEATALLAGYAFAQRRLHKLRAMAFAFNEASRRVLEKVGFSREGVDREGAFVGGEYVDVLEYGLLESEYDPGGDERTGAEREGTGSP